MERDLKPKVHVLRETVMKFRISWDVRLCRLVNSYRCSENWKEGSEFKCGVKFYRSWTSWPRRRHFIYSVTNHSSRRHNIPEECVEYLSELCTKLKSHTYLLLILVILSVRII